MPEGIVFDSANAGKDKEAGDAKAEIESVFTLIELLVVIAIIAVWLRSSPALSRRARPDVSCTNNLKLLGMALIMYTHDSDGASDLRPKLPLPVPAFPNFLRTTPWSARYYLAWHSATYHMSFNIKPTNIQ